MMGSGQRQVREKRTYIKSIKLSVVNTIGQIVPITNRSKEIMGKITLSVQKVD